MGAISFGSNFNIGAKGPIDSRMRVEYISDLTSVWTTAIPAYKGMVVTVLEDASLYVLSDDDAAVSSNWKKIDATATITSENYSSAKELAKADNLGQIIYVKKEETIGEETYSGGPYIVTGEGTLSKLGTTSASGDISGDVEKLKGDVSNLDTRVTTLEDDTTHVLGGDDID